jgi:hypothetical protein
VVKTDKIFCNNMKHTGRSWRKENGTVDAWIFTKDTSLKCAYVK